ncbi:hypothetical protein KOR42_42220 [Thalassoglobus neptunius]|uniref:Uncharacterized protein n=1 Tax=Thalassoglobus neptunius TaxID=1938619 RepID=A0A5C5WA05_9PLAN|nr:hypothetical protein KOR42_42220 [Thalassoglobus neptunius]
MFVLNECLAAPFSFFRFDEQLANVKPNCPGWEEPVQNQSPR